MRRPRIAVSSAYLRNMVLGEGLVQSFVYRVNRKGLRTEPCGAPVLEVSAGEVVSLVVLVLNPDCLFSIGEEVVKEMDQA